MPSTSPSTTACHHVSMSPSSAARTYPQQEPGATSPGEIAPAAICKATLRTAGQAPSAHVKIHSLCRRGTRHEPCKNPCTMQGEESAGLLAWLGLIGAYGWTVRSLARVRRMPAASDVASRRRPRLVAMASPRGPKTPAVRQPQSGRVQMGITDLLTEEVVVAALGARGSVDV